MNHSADVFGEEKLRNFVELNGENVRNPETSNVLLKIRELVIACLLIFLLISPFSLLSSRSFWLFRCQVINCFLLVFRFPPLDCSFFSQTLWHESCLFFYLVREWAFKQRFYNIKRSERSKQKEILHIKWVLMWKRTFKSYGYRSFPMVKQWNNVHGHEKLSRSLFYDHEMRRKHRQLMNSFYHYSCCLRTFSSVAHFSP